MIRYNPKLNIGLTTKQVEERYNNNLVNYDTNVKTKSNVQIILTNIFTLFNLLNVVLALLILSVGSYKNMLFMGIVISNILISTIQELRAKHIIDKLSVISSNKLEVIRDGKTKILSINEIVLDDLINFKSGNQVIVDSIILKGECEVNESFITGEQKTIYKKEGDLLLSGSFIISGSTVSRVEHIGIDNYTAKISKEAKYLKKIQSQILSSLNKILKIMGIVIIPVGLLLFYKQYYLLNSTFTNSIISVVGALIGMIPEGLVLLTSTVFAVAVQRLSKYNILVQNIYSIETLARVDTLCLDKTGTITEGIMEVKDIIPINESYNIDEILSNFCYNFDDVNQTLKALQNKYEKKDNYKVKSIVPFSSIKKWSGVSYQNDTYIMGAPEYLLKDTKDLNQYINNYRTLALMHSNNSFNDKELPNDLELIAIILIQDKIRSEVKNIIDYFNKQNVDIKIISGDNPITVKNIAERCNIISCDKYIDMSLKKKIDYDEIVKKYTIFGRVNPNQKKEIILALKRNNRVVGMTGDGVNDVLALKEADCSISFRSGTEAARNVSELVLLDDNFNSVLEAIKEGRRSINNIERSASLFLVKTIFATILALIFLFINMPYPFMPIQLTLTSTVTIGIPSLILALEPNHNIVKGKFLTNVISKALPAALTIVINIIGILIASYLFKINLASSSTMCVISNAIVGFFLLYRVCKPFNLNRRILFVSMLCLFFVQSILFRELFSLVILKPIEYIILFVILICSNYYFKLFNKLYIIIVKRYPKWFN